MKKIIKINVGLIVGEKHEEKVIWIESQPLIVGETHEAIVVAEPIKDEEE